MSFLKLNSIKNNSQISEWFCVKRDFFWFQFLMRIYCYCSPYFTYSSWSKWWFKKNKKKRNLVWKLNFTKKKISIHYVKHLRHKLWKKSAEKLFFLRIWKVFLMISFMMMMTTCSHCNYTCKQTTRKRFRILSVKSGDTLRVTNLQNG